MKIECMLKQNFTTLKVKTTSFKNYLFGIILYYIERSFDVGKVGWTDKIQEKWQPNRLLDDILWINFSVAIPNEAFSSPDHKTFFSFIKAIKTEVVTKIPLSISRHIFDKLGEFYFRAHVLFL